MNRAALFTLLIGAFGVLIATALSAPAPFLIGPAAAVSLAGLLGVSLHIPTWLRDGSFVLIGLSMGTQATPEVFTLMLKWPISLCILCLAIAGILFCCQSVLTRFFAYGQRAAILTASPGHLSFVLGLAESHNDPVARIAIAQTIRVLCLTLLVPFCIHWMGLLTPVESSKISHSMSPMALLISILSAIAVGLLLGRWRVPAALLLGGMIFSTFSHMGGWIEGDLPTWLSYPAFAMMGCLIGTRFGGVSLQALRQSAAAGLTLTAISLFIATLAALITAQLTNLPLAQLLVAYAPGGIETMAAMALMIEADPTFVAIHHIARLFLLSVLVPITLVHISPRDPLQ